MTWSNGTTGITGGVTPANSFYGADNNVVELTNGNYVIVSPDWSNDVYSLFAGAVTWGNGTSGITGSINPFNSILGTKEHDNLGSGGVVPLADGNYVVISPNWDNGEVTNAGWVGYQTQPPEIAEVTINEQMLFNAMKSYWKGNINIVLPDIQPSAILMTIGFTDNAIATVHMNLSTTNGVVVVSLDSINFQQGYTLSHEATIQQELTPLFLSAMNDLLGNFTSLLQLTLNQQEMVFSLLP